MNKTGAISLRAKMISAAIVMTVMLIVAGALGLRSLSLVMRSLEETRVAIQNDGTLAEMFQPHFVQAQAVYRQYKLLTIGGVLVAIFAPILTAIYFIRTVFGPLPPLVHAMQRASLGDLTIELTTDRRDEVGQAVLALNTLVARLHESIRRVSQAAESVAAGSQDLRLTGERLSLSAQEQASSLEETAASMEEMTASVKQNADNVLHAAAIAGDARRAASEGLVIAASVKQSMTAIDASSARVVDITNVIDDLAFQTNLLALNAAVEAARAGEHGRGFAVVAAEVRGLAQRCASAAKEIKVLIHDSADKVQEGARLVNTSSEAIEGIVESVQKTESIIAEISAASQEQAAGIEQVNRAVVQMDGLTQSNAAQVEELSRASQSLAVQAKQLRSLVSHFTLRIVAVATNEKTNVSGTGGESLL